MPGRGPAFLFGCSCAAMAGPSQAMVTFNFTL